MVFWLFLAGYLLGSVPFGLIVAAFWRIDIRKYGSGNIGATNVLRTLGIVPGGLVFALDMLKGTAAVMLAAYYLSDPLVIVGCGLAAVLGHTFSLFLRFQGGRGAATGLGVLLGVAPDLFLFAVVLFTLIVGLTRYVSLGSVLTALAVTLAFFAFGRPLPYSLAAAAISLVIILRHIPNIKRLFQGTERRLGEKG
ncbi:MAG: glycerol-3-phosphate 1-O-acyltransferase PlsY [Candidatus Margulisiibacteriota bacterium]